MTKETLTLLEEMEKTSSRIWEDLQSLLVNLSGNLKDIECGTHIKIPTGAGYVSFYRSQDAWKLSYWFSQEMTEQVKENLNFNDET